MRGAVSEPHDNPHVPKAIPLISTVVVIFLCWAIPRMLVRTLGIDGHWTPYLYQYLLGGLVFVIGLAVIRLSGACDFRRPGDRRFFWVLVFGYAWYAGMHGLLTYLAQAVPFRG